VQTVADDRRGILTDFWRQPRDALRLSHTH
jgi:hypothetical protein